jgi:hypothetical protein
MFAPRGKPTARGKLGRFCKHIRRWRVARYCCYGGVPVLLLVLLGGSCCVDITGASGVRAVSVALAAPAPCESTAQESELIKRASTDPIGLLEEGVRLHQEHLQDYEGTFSFRRPEDRGLGELVVCRFKFRAEPFSVALQWIQGASRIDRVLYVKGQNGNQMMVHPTGLAGRLVSGVKVDPHGERATKGGQRPVTQFGLRNALTRVLESYKKDAGQGTLQSSCLGLGELNGARVITLEKVRSEEKLIIDLEAKMLSPVRIRHYASDGRLLAFYQYGDLRFNCGFNDATFSRNANGF